MNNQEKLKRFLQKKKKDAIKNEEKNYISTLDSSVKKPDKRLLTGLLTLDYLLNGLMEGSLYEISGKPSAGKSTLSWKLLEKLQYIYNGISIYYNDIEGTSQDETFLNRFPLLKREEVIIDSNPNIEDFFVNLEEISSIVDVVFIDTVAMMDPKIKIDLEKSEMGKIAGLMTRGWKRFFDIARNGIRMIAINQLRDNLDPYSGNTGPKTPGGNAYHYALTGQIEIKRDGGQSKAEKEKDIFGNEKIKNWNTVIKVHKNKQGPFGKSINTVLNTSDEKEDRFNTFDEVKDLIAFAKVFGFIEQSGSINTIYDMRTGAEKQKIKGKDALENYLRTNIDDYIELKAFIYKQLLPKDFFYCLYDKIILICKAEKVMFNLKNKINFNKPIQKQLSELLKNINDDEEINKMKELYPIQLFFSTEELQELEKEYGIPWTFSLYKGDIENEEIE